MLRLMSLFSDGKGKSLQTTQVVCVSDTEEGTSNSDREEGPGLSHSLQTSVEPSFSTARGNFVLDEVSVVGVRILKSNFSPAKETHLPSFGPFHKSLKVPPRSFW